LPALIRIDASDADYAAGLAAQGRFHWFCDEFTIEPRIEYFRSFSVVPPCEAFASLFQNIYSTIGKKIRSNTLSPSHLLSL